MKRFIALFSALVLGGLSSVASAQGVMDEVYGRGVHAYFAGDDTKATEWLDSVIAAGSQDPRVYYYRGLIKVRQGGGVIDPGAADFQQAATLEITSGRVVNVARALERIQGSLRRDIEDIRLKTRLQNKDRLPKPPVVSPAPSLDSTVDPFTDDRGLGEPTEITPPVVTPPVDTTVPETPADTVAPPAEAPVPDSADPFGGSTTAPETETPAASEDPFGTN